MRQLPAYYNDQEIRDLLRRAEAVGLPLGEGSPVEQLTIGQLDAILRGSAEELD